MRARLALGLALAVAVAVGTGPARASPRAAGVQVALRALGLYLGPIDGDPGPETAAAIRAAQQRARLAVNGVAGASTRRSLGPLGRPLLGTRVLRRGDFGLDVSEVQFLLTRDGMYAGALDGYFGPEVEGAIRRYQRQAKLAVDGAVGPLTRAALLRPPVAPPTVSRPGRQEYVVRSGDSLTAIAQHFGVTVSRLARANRLDPARTLPVGIRLAVPAAPTPGSVLAATSGDVRSSLDAWSGRLGVSPHLVRALAWMESGFQPQVVSPVGARGVLQLLPTTRQFVEDVLAGHALPHTLDGDVEAGVLYLRHLLMQFGGDTTLALAAWYEGEAAVRRFGIYQVTRPFVADVVALAARM